MFDDNLIPDSYIQDAESVLSGGGQQPPPSAMPSSDSLEPESEASLEPDPTQHDETPGEMARRISIREKGDPELTAAMMARESNGKKRATSWTGNAGLMQISDAVHRKYGIPGRDKYDPESNITAGVRYMNFLVDKFGGDKKKALAAYNLGENSKALQGKNWWNKIQYATNDPDVRAGRKPRGPSDQTNTQNYVKNIWSNYQNKIAGTQMNYAITDADIAEAEGMFKGIQQPDIDSAEKTLAGPAGEDISTDDIAQAEKLFKPSGELPQPTLGSGKAMKDLPAVPLTDQQDREAVVEAAQADNVQPTDILIANAQQKPAAKLGVPSKTTSPGKTFAASGPVISEESYDKQGNLIPELSPTSNLKTKVVAAKDAGETVADRIDIPEEIKTADDANKYVQKYLKAKYPEGDFSKFNWLEEYAPGHGAIIDFNSLKAAGVDTDSIIRQKVIEKQSLNPVSDLRRVPFDFAKVTSEDINDLTQVPFTGYSKAPGALATSFIASIGDLSGMAAGIIDAANEFSPSMNAIKEIVDHKMLNPNFDKMKPESDSNPRMINRYNVKDPTVENAREFLNESNRLNALGGDQDANGRDTIPTIAFKMIGQVPKIAILSAFPGGMIGGFALEGGSLARLRGEGITGIVKGAVKEGLYGALLKFLPSYVQKALGTGGEIAGETLAPSVTRQFVSAGTEVATIGVGSYTIGKAFGDPDQENLINSLAPAVFHTAGLSKEALVGKGIHAVDSKGNEIYVKLDENGKLISTLPQPSDIEMFLPDNKSRQTPIPETQTALDAQEKSAADQSQTKRVGVMYPGGEGAPKQGSKYQWRVLLPNGDVVMVDKGSWAIKVNTKETPEGITPDKEGLLRFIEAGKNDKAVQELVGRVEPVSDTSQGNAVVAREGGKQVDAAVVTNPETQAAQEASYQEQHPEAEVVTVPTQQAARERARDLVSESADEDHVSAVTKRLEFEGVRAEQLSRALDSIPAEDLAANIDSLARSVGAPASDAIEAIKRFTGRDYLQQYLSVRLAADTPVVPPVEEVAPSVTMTKEQIVNGIARHNPNADMEATRQMLPDGDYVLKDVPLSEIKGTMGKAGKAKVEDYKGRDTQAPPIIMDDKGTVVDGKHRYTAAKARGDETIKSWVPVEKQAAEAPVREREPVKEPEPVKAAEPEDTRTDYQKWNDTKDQKFEETHGRPPTSSESFAMMNGMDVQRAATDPTVMHPEPVPHSPGASEDVWDGVVEGLKEAVRAPQVDDETSTKSVNKPVAGTASPEPIHIEPDQIPMEIRADKDGGYTVLDQDGEHIHTFETQKEAQRFKKSVPLTADRAEQMLDIMELDDEPKSKIKSYAKKLEKAGLLGPGTVESMDWMIKDRDMGVEDYLYELKGSLLRPDDPSSESLKEAEDPVKYPVGNPQAAPVIVDQDVPSSPFSAGDTVYLRDGSEAMVASVTGDRATLHMSNGETMSNVSVHTLRDDPDAPIPSAKTVSNISSPSDLEARAHKLWMAGQLPHEYKAHLENWISNGYLKEAEDMLNKIDKDLSGGTAMANEPSSISMETGADMQVMVALIGEHMYQNELVPIVIKEIMQNSVDAVKGAMGLGQHTKGKIHIHTDATARTITFTDNGIGMDRDTIQNAYMILGGSRKPMGEAENGPSGGLGMAKAAFLFGTDGVDVTTVRDGKKYEFTVTKGNLPKENPVDVKVSDTNEPNGTTQVVHIPSEIVTSIGSRFIYMDDDVTQNARFFDRPLLGNIDVTSSYNDGGRWMSPPDEELNAYYEALSRYHDALDRGEMVGRPDSPEDRFVESSTDPRTIEVGNAFPMHDYELFTHVTFKWGPADVYISKNKNTSWSGGTHSVLSNGTFQFDHKVYAGDKGLPYNVIIDMHPTVKPTDADYPFNNSRESFRHTIEPDIRALQNYLARVGLADQAAETIDQFKTIHSLPRVGNRVDPDSLGYDPTFIKGDFESHTDPDLVGEVDRALTANKDNLKAPELQTATNIRINDGSIVTASDVSMVGDWKKEREEAGNQKIAPASFTADTPLKSPEQMFTDLGLEPGKPLYHNNTDTDWYQLGQTLGFSKEHVATFFSELGNLVQDFSNRMMEVYHAGYYMSLRGMGNDPLGRASGPLFSGISIDKSYRGVYVNTSFRGLFLNPLTVAELAEGDPGAMAREYVRTLIHEVSHTTGDSHGESFVLKFHDNMMIMEKTGDWSVFVNRFGGLLDKYGALWGKLRDEYSKSSTRNRSESLAADRQSTASERPIKGNETDRRSLENTPSGGERPGSDSDIRPGAGHAGEVYGRESGEDSVQADIERSPVTREPIAPVRNESPHDPGDVVTTPEGHGYFVRQTGDNTTVEINGVEKEFHKNLVSAVDRSQTGAVSLGLLTLGGRTAALLEPIGAVAQDIQRGFAPATVSDAAKITGGSMREWMARAQRSFEIAEHALMSARKYFAGRSVQDNYNFMKAVEYGSPDNRTPGLTDAQHLEATNLWLALTPEERAAAATLRSLLDQSRTTVQDLGTGKLETFIENYFPHFWKQPGNLKNIWNKVFGKRPFEGQAGFLKQRTYRFFSEGFENGKIPLSDNPVDLTLYKVKEMGRYVMAHRVLAELNDAGLRQFVRTGHTPPEGWVKINDKISDVRYVNDAGELVIAGSYYTPPEAARIINNHLSPGLAASPYFGTAFRLWRMAGNAMNQAQLSLSGFHLSFTTIDTMVSKAALGLNQAASGQFSNLPRTIGGLPTAFVEGIIKGNRLRQEWLEPGSTDPITQAVVENLMKAGGRVKTDDFYRSTIANKMMDGFRRGTAAGYISGAIRAPFAALGLPSKLILEGVVPRQKLGIFFDLAQHEVQRLGPDATPQEIRQSLGRIWDSVDDRMGQLVYDNLFWDNVHKDLALASVRSVGWNLGSYRTFLGGAMDIATLPYRAGRMLAGKPESKPLITERMAYVAMLPVVAGTLGAFIQYMYTGEPPKELKDLYFPRTGNFDENGKPERLSIPTYIKDLYAYYKNPMQTMSHKVHPLAETVVESLENKDFYGTKIRNEDDPVVRQMFDVTKFGLEAFIPFSIRGVQKQAERKGSATSMTLSMFGFLPAPAALSKSAAEETLAQIAGEKTPQSARTQKDKIAADTIRSLVREKKLGNNISDDFEKAKASGVLEDSDLDLINRRASLDYLESGVKARDVDDAMKIWRVATPEEKQRLHQIMVDKLFSSVLTSGKQNAVDALLELGIKQESIDPLLESYRQKTARKRNEQNAIDLAKSGDISGLKTLNKAELKDAQKQIALTDDQLSFSSKPVEIKLAEFNNPPNDDVMVQAAQVPFLQKDLAALMRKKIRTLDDTKHLRELQASIMQYNQRLNSLPIDQQKAALSKSAAAANLIRSQAYRPKRVR